MKFKDWFDNKLIIGSFPDIFTIQRKKIEVIINVSEQYNFQLAGLCIQNGIEYHWFPLCEFSNYDNGINSIFAACWVLFNMEMQNKKVYLHCHAGANRSPTVADAYFYMRTGKHKEYEPKLFDAEFNKIFTNKEGENFTEDDYREINNNRLLENIRQGHLPAVTKFNEFLKIIGKQFTKQFDNDKHLTLDDMQNRDNLKCFLSLDTARLEAQI